MDEHVFRLLELLSIEGSKSYADLYESYQRFSFTDEEFKKALNILTDRKLLTYGDIANNQRELYVLLTPNGDNIYKTESKNREFEFDTLRLQMEKEVAESTLIKRQLELTDYQIKNEKWQAILNPLLEQSNTSTIKTNENIRQTNVTLKMIFLATALFSLFGVAATVYNIHMENLRNHSIQELKAKDSLIKVLQEEISQLKNKK